MRKLTQYLIIFVFSCVFSLSACDCEDCLVEEFYLPVITGKVTVATDNQANPVEIAYKTTGKNDGRPVIVFCDGYMGIDSWDVQQKVFGIKNYTIAFDPVGFGLSSTNSPTDLDGVNGHAGYSFRQQATFLHKLLETLDTHGPITYVAVDSNGQVGIWYATDYANDPYSFEKLCFENTTVESIVSSDPCSLAFLTVEQAQQLVGFFAIDPAASINALLGTTFLTPNCPEVQQILNDLTADFMTTTTPEIFGRLFLGTFLEDVSPLMENITIPVLNFYGSAGGDFLPVSRRAIGATFFGNSPGYSNPLIPGDCANCCRPVVNPFPDSRLITYPGHGTIVHLTACRRFNRELRDFIKGKDAECSLCIPMAQKVK